MPKKKKTLKQKKQTDQRRIVTHDVVHSSQTVSSNNASHEHAAAPSNAPQGTTFSLPTGYAKRQATSVSAPTSRATTATISTGEYNYLSKDLLKTAFLTTFIVVAELVIKFFFERG